MSDDVSRATALRRKGLAITVLGALVMVGSALVGFLLLQGPRDLSPVAYGERLTVTTERNSSVGVYTPTGLEAPPACRVTTSTGVNVVLGPAERYSQADGLEATYSFVTAGGTPYLVSCGTGGQAGQFAAVETRSVSTPPFIAGGILGLVLLVGGLILARPSGRSAVR